MINSMARIEQFGIIIRLTESVLIVLTVWSAHPFVVLFE